MCFFGWDCNYCCMLILHLRFVCCVWLFAWLGQFGFVVWLYDYLVVIGFPGYLFWCDCVVVMNWF